MNCKSIVCRVFKGFTRLLGNFC